MDNMSLLSDLALFPDTAVCALQTLLVLTPHATQHNILFSIKQLTKCNALQS